LYYTFERGSESTICSERGTAYRQYEPQITCLRAYSSRHKHSKAQRDTKHAVTSGTRCFGLDDKQVSTASLLSLQRLLKESSRSTEHQPIAKTPGGQLRVGSAWQRCKFEVRVKLLYDLLSLPLTTCPYAQSCYPSFIPRIVLRFCEPKPDQFRYIREFQLLLRYHPCMDGKRPAMPLRGVRAYQHTVQLLSWPLMLLTAPAEARWWLPLLVGHFVVLTSVDL
jgi:hypothetical protein